MKNYCTLLMFIAMGLSTFANTNDVKVLPRVPNSKYADLESHIVEKIKLPNDQPFNLTLWMECNVAKNNALRVALGCDDNNDGNLSIGEFYLIFGWDCGNFETINYETMNTPVSLRQRATLKMIAAKSGACESLEIYDGDKLLQTPKALSDKLEPGKWTHIKVIRNGAPPTEECVRWKVDVR